MPVTIVPTARELESCDEPCIFAIAVGGSLGSGNETPGEIAKLVVHSGAAVTTCPPRSGAGAPRDRSYLLGIWWRPTVYALQYKGARGLDFSVAARQVRLMFVVTDIMYPELSVAKLTQQGFKAEFGQKARLVGVNSGRCRLCGAAAEFR